MDLSNYRVQGYDRFRDVIPLDCIELALAWIRANRKRSEVETTFDLFDRQQTLPIKLRKLWSVEPEFWLRFIERSGLLTIIEEVLGPDFTMIRSAAFIKYPRSSAFVGWHRDEDLWGHNCEAAVTAWLALTDATERDGCLQFVAGSHLKAPGPLRMDFRHPYHKVMDITDLGVPSPQEALAGDCILMDKATVHASSNNAGDRERIGLVFVFALCDKSFLNEPAVRFSRGRAAAILR